jgi:Ca-activated chloride channel family protein
VTTTNAPLAPPAVAGWLGDRNGMLPLAAVEIDAVVCGLVATTTVRQTFRNTRTTGIEASYVFPLPDRAGVTAFVADLAGRRVEGELRERGEARAEYDAAIAAGHRAAITEEERSGVFSTRVGNLQPGEDAVITLTLTGPLAIDDGAAEYRFPLVVAPRYVAGQPLPWPPVGCGTAADTDAVPDASRVTPPVLLPGLASPVRLALRARLTGLGLAPDAIRSSLHAVAATADADGAVEVALQPGERLDRDVVLRFPVAGATTRTIATVAPDDEDPTTGTWHVTVVPPGTGGHAPATGRDVVVVLDRSGSMHGWKIAAARRAAARIVDSLAVRDRFAVLAFDTVTERPPGLDALVPASDRNRWTAIEWLARLEARGGTEMLEPLRDAATMLADTALAGSILADTARADTGPADSAPADTGLADTGLADTGWAGTDQDVVRDRFLVLVTDGQVAAEDQILAALAPVTGRTRVFALGVDQAVNAGFLRRLAALGAGRCELVESENRLDEVMTGLHRRISPPLVTGLRLESPALELLADETAPARRPDLFPGAPCSLSGRWRAGAPPSTLTLTVRGDGGFSEQVPVTTITADPAVRTCWARARVRDLEDRYAAGAADPALAERIVAASLGHRVLSRFTAFVAVDRTRRADLSPPQPVIQPVELPGGWAGTVVAAQPLHAMAIQPTTGPPRRATLARLGGPAAGARPAVIPGAPPGPGPYPGPVPLEAYLVRAGELFARIDADLGERRDRGRLGAMVDELADDLASVGAPDYLRDALRRLAGALRGSGDLWVALTAARRVFTQGAPTPAHPGEPGPVEYPVTGPPLLPPPLPRPAPLAAEPEARRRWWR